MLQGNPLRELIRESRWFGIIQTAPNMFTFLMHCRTWKTASHTHLVPEQQRMQMKYLPMRMRRSHKILNCMWLIKCLFKVSFLIHGRNRVLPSFMAFLLCS